MPKASLDICKSSLVASHRTTLSQLSKPANKTLPYPTYTGRIEEYSLEAKGELNGQILFRQLEVVEPRAPLAMIQPLILLFNIHISGSEPCPALLGQMSAGLVCHAWRAALLEAVPSAHPAPWRCPSWFASFLLPHGHHLHQFPQASRSSPHLLLMTLDK